MKLVAPSAIEKTGPRGGSFVELRSYRVPDDVLRLLGRGSGILTIDSQTPGAPTLVDYLDVLRRGSLRRSGSVFLFR